MFTSSTYVALFLAATASCVSAQSNATSGALDPDAPDCFITVPADPLTAKGLSTPYILQPPCSMAVEAQQAFVEAAVFDPATGGLSIYHPLVTNAGEEPAAAPVVPNLPKDAVIGIWYGFNGGTLQLVDSAGKDTNTSPLLQAAECINGLSGVEGDVFGQVSWCNAEQWFAAVNQGIKAGSVKIPELGLDKNGNTCPSSRSFSVTDADPSDNVPTQYILIGNATAQDTDANRKTFNPEADGISSGSDAALLTNILDPLIGCQPFLAPSLDNPGAMVPALALSELQAALEVNPAFVPLNDPDCLLTKDGSVSVDKTNTYRLGVNQPIIGSNDTSGALQPFCDGLVAGTPPFLKSFEKTFNGEASPDSGIADNLLDFLAGRYLSALDTLKCPPPTVQPITCKTDGKGLTTSCVIDVSLNGANNTINAVSNTITTSATTTASVETGRFTNTTTDAAATGKGGKDDDGKDKGKDKGKGNGKGDDSKTTAAVADSVSAISTAAASAVTTNGVTTITKVIIIEHISFFIFVINLGGHLPPAVLLGEEVTTEFVVLEETFTALAPACQRACNHQFDACSKAANKPGSRFSVADCKSQEDNCLGVAATATPTASTPATLTATATVVSTTAASTTLLSTTASSTNAASTTAAAAQATQPAAADGDDKDQAADNLAAGTNAACAAPTATVTVAHVSVTSVTHETVTVTVTDGAQATASSSASSGAAASTGSTGFQIRGRYAARHLRKIGKY